MIETRQGRSSAACGFRKWRFMPANLRLWPTESTEYPPSEVVEVYRLPQAPTAPLPLIFITLNPCPTLKPLSRAVMS